MDVPTLAQRLLPTPRSLTSSGAGLTFDAGSVIDVGRAPEPGTLAVAEALADLLRRPTGYAWPVVRGSHARRRIALRQGGPASLGEEGYLLGVGRRTATVTAPHAAGLYRGAQTLRQLLPAAVERREHAVGVTWSVPGVVAVDRPRYPVRAVMLDVARHFLGVDEVERFVDAMVPLKLNTLVLHLTDDQGWRLEIRSWPRLATFGGAQAVGGGAGGAYTQEEYAGLVAYAAARHVTVVPEIDLPGHTQAALASYPELNASGVAPERYTGTEVGFSSLDADLEVTYRFLDDVLGEVAALTPGRHVSIGGDEAYSTSAADYRRMVEHAGSALQRHGKVLWGWHQVAAAEPVEGSVAAYWGVAGQEADAELARRAARQGQRLVLAPADHAYLDMKHDPTDPLGLDWAGCVSVADAYRWDPATLVPGVPASAVAGVLAPVWTETLADLDAVERMAFPRLAGVAQLGWSPRRTHDLEPYLVQLAVQGPRWEAAGVNFHRSPEVAWRRFG